MASDAYRDYRDLLELVRGFMPHNPLEARLRVAEVVDALERASARGDGELSELLARAQMTLAEYGRAADTWQAENARRQERFQARERAALQGPGKP